MVASSEKSRVVGGGLRKRITERLLPTAPKPKGLSCGVSSFLRRFGSIEDVGRDGGAVGNKSSSGVLRRSGQCR